MVEKLTTEAQTGADLGSMNRIHNVGGVTGSFIALPDGYEVHDLEAFQESPNYARADVTVREVRSLTDYLARFATSATVAFADWRSRKIRAMVDYHSPLEPSHCEHVCTFLAQLSASWAAWRKMHDQPQGQVAFARFLEEREHEIVEPEAADVVEVAMNLDAIKKVSFKSAVWLSDGYRQLSYTEEDQTKGGVRVPEFLSILVPIFEGQDPQRVRLRLRHRIDDGRLLLWITVDNLDDLERDAFEHCIDAVAIDGPQDMPIYRAIL